MTSRPAVLDDHQLGLRLRATFDAVDATTPPSPVPAPPARATARPVRPVGAIRTRRLVLGGAALAAVGTGIAAVVGTRTFTPSAAAAARSALHRAARNARTAPFVTPRADQYVYSRTVSTYYADTKTHLLTDAATPDPGSTSYPVSDVAEMWKPVDPARAGLQTAGRPVFLRPGDRDKARAAGLLRADGRLRNDYLGPTQHLDPHTWGADFTAASWPFLASLPTDVDALYARVESYSRGAGPSLHAEMLVTIDDALRGTLAPPALIAAFYEVAARIPGIELVPGVVDLDGRRGVAVAIGTSGTRQDTIFDDTTGTLLGHRSVLVSPWQGHPAGTVINSDAVTVTVVDHLGDR